MHFGQRQGQRLHVVQRGQKQHSIARRKTKKPIFFLTTQFGNVNFLFLQATNGLKLIEGKYSDGNLYCRFERQAQFVIGDKRFDMAKDYILFLARGPASDNGISYHDRQKTVSSRAE
jgi:hypothetical protein